MYVIYMDVLFFINFIMDTIIFWIVSMLVNECIKMRKIVIGGAIGAGLYCLLVILPFLQYVPYGVYSFFIPILPILYIFKPIHVKQLFKYYVLSMLVAALLGGISFSLWYMLGNSNSTIDHLQIGELIGIGLGVGFAFYGAFYSIRKRVIFPMFEYKMKLVNKDKETTVKALLDTGNCLYTPITHRPVIVAEYEKIKPLFSEKEQALYEKFSDNLLELVQMKNHGMQYIIPFNSMGCEEGMILGVEIDEVILEKMSIQRHFYKCIIGIVRMPLFNDHSYKALLHPEYILGEVG